MQTLQRIILSLICLAFPCALPAVTITSYSFIPTPQGANPGAALLCASDGNFYGTTKYGGTFNNGTIFKLTPGGALTTLVNFNGLNGSQPTAELIQASDGNIYGTTSLGGSGGKGTVFELIPSGGGFTVQTLASFSDNNGSNPNCLIQGSDGNFYGTTEGGGVGSGGHGGIIFKLAPGSSGYTFTTLYSFGFSLGYMPNGLVQHSDGNFYGTTFGGGTSYGGTLFQLLSSGTGYTMKTLVNFDGFNSKTSIGNMPDGRLLLGNDGNLYGTTFGGGNYGRGTFFRFTPSSGTSGLSNLFNFSTLDERGPKGKLVQDGASNFYGTTNYGVIQAGQNGGTLFKLSSSGSSGYTLTTLVSNTDPSFLGYAPCLGGDGNIYATTYQTSGTADNGTVIKVTPDGTSLSQFYTFNAVLGINPTCIIKGSDGNFYGTTSDGFENNTIFKMTPTGALSTVASLDDVGLTYVNPQLVQGSDGNFYGTTNDGDNTNGNGDFFQVTPSGVVTSYAFTGGTGSGTAADPHPDLVQARDGNFYGTTKYGGSANAGCVYKIASTGTFSFTYLAPILIANHFGSIQSPLVQGPGTDNNLYVSSVTGGTSNTGGIFKISTTSGGMTNVYSFGTSNGGCPGGLTLGTNGNFYLAGNGALTGQTSVALYKYTPPNAFVTVVTGSDSGGRAASFPALTQGTDGNFYGTTQYGGDPIANAGTIFVTSTNGTLTTLAVFSGSSGIRPNSALVQGADGSFYGVASGGSANAGVVYSFNPSW